MSEATLTIPEMDPSYVWFTAIQNQAICKCQRPDTSGILLTIPQVATRTISTTTFAIFATLTIYITANPPRQRQDLPLHPRTPRLRHLLSATAAGQTHSRQPHPLSTYSSLRHRPPSNLVRPRPRRSRWAPSARRRRHHSPHHQRDTDGHCAHTGSVPRFR